MEYDLLNLKDGDVLTSEHISHLENGIQSIKDEADYMKKTMVNILGDKDVSASTDEELSDILRKFTYLKNPDIKEYDGYTADLIDIKTGIESGTIRMVITDQEKFQMKVAATKDFTVDWGDGTEDTYTSSSNLVSISHTYKKGTGQYYDGSATQFMATISPSENSEIIQTQSKSNNAAMASTNSLLFFVSKDVYFQKVEYMFLNHKYLKGIEIIGGSLGINELNISFSSFVYNCNKLAYISANVCWRSVTSLDSALQNCSSLETLDLGDSWDTNNCTTFANAFNGCSKLKKIPPLITNTATSIVNMCYNCISLKEVEGDTWNLDSCTSMASAFYGCNSLTTLPYFQNTNNVRNTNSCFIQCKSIVRFNDKQISFNLSSCTNAAYMFSNCASLEELPELILDNVTTVSHMCENCSNLYITQSSFNLPKVIGTVATQELMDNGTGLSKMFSNCTSLISAPEINAPNAIDAGWLFWNCSNLKVTPEVYSFSKLQNAHSLFRGCTSLETAPRILEFPEATCVSALFYGCTSLKIAPAPNSGDSFNFPKATRINQIFHNCYALQTAPKILEFESATSANEIFWNCNALQIPPNKISAPNAITAKSLFYNCYSLTACPELELPLCTNLNDCFRNCYAITSTIPYYFPKLNSAERFYQYCESLETIEEVKTDATTFNVKGFAMYCKGLLSVKAPVCTNGHLVTSSQNADMLWDGTQCTALKKITNAIDVFSMSYEMRNRLLGSKYLEEITLSGLKNELTLDNKPYLTKIRLENPQAGMANLTITNCALDEAAINQLFEDLPTVSTTRTINVKGNPGAESCNTSIATAKNWTVLYI